jgi:hypothetical protein
MSKEETSSLKIKADAYLRKHRIIELFEVIIDKYVHILTLIYCI